MTLRTILIGSYPKPEYLQIPDWFKEGTTSYDPTTYNKYVSYLPFNNDYLILKATKEVIETCDELGIDILTDGEIRQENYIHHFCRYLQGIDFDLLTNVPSRNEAYRSNVPTVTSKIINDNESILGNNWQISTLFTKKPVKIQIPGPMTIKDTIANNYYSNDEDMLNDLSIAINKEIKTLIKLGCKYIQIDEPLFARKPYETCKYGVKYIEKCFEGVPENITKIVHCCCGYPDKLDETDYPKADTDCYKKISKVIDDSCVNMLSIEDAHRHNDYELFSMFKKTTIILGVVDISSSKVETVESIKERIELVGRYIPYSRLVIAPDCGMGMLSEELICLKLKNMVEACKLVKTD